MRSMECERRPWLRHVRTAGAEAIVMWSALGLLVQAGCSSADESTGTTTDTLSAIGGEIARSEVLARAQYWVDHQPGPYDQGAYSPDPSGSKTYRRDCSGYVSMCWHLASSYVTSTLPQVSNAIARAELMPGDILNDAANHVILFNAWEDDHVYFSYYSFGATPVKKVSHFSIHAATIDSHPNSNYVARRYVHILDDPPPQVEPVEYDVMAGDVTGEGRSDLVTLSPEGGGAWADWAALELSTGDGFASTTWAASTPAHMRNGGSKSDYHVVQGDFDGNGKVDLATITRDGGGGWADWLALELSNGSGFTSATWPGSTPTHMRNGGSSADYRVLAGDFNADGKSDILTISPNGGGGWADWAALELSTGRVGFHSTTWSAATPTHMRNGGTSADYRVLVGDFNGDGKSDVLTMSPNAGGGWSDWAALELSTGTGFVSANWAGSTPTHMRNGGTSADYRVLVGDFNGDGKSDVLTMSPNAGGGWSDWAALELSTGTGFVSANWAGSTPTHMRNGGASANYRVLVGDFNGDGKSDLATVSPNAAGAWSDWVALELSTGTGFVSANWAGSTPTHMRNGGASANYRVLVGDFNGDGKSDLATVSPNAAGAWSDWVALELSTGSGFASKTWASNTPKHIRNGGY